MGIELNHTIVSCRDKERSSTFLTEMFDLPPATSFGAFAVVELSNNVSLDFLDYGVEEPVLQHYAFLVSEEEFTTIFARIVERQLDYWADPFRAKRGEINHNDGGRGVYFPDPDGHLMEIITRPYGSGA